MSWRDFYQLDAWRCVDLRGGLVGNGYHDFLMDEIEVGPRVAMAFDEEDQAFWVLQPEPWGTLPTRLSIDDESQEEQ